MRIVSFIFVFLIAVGTAFGQESGTEQLNDLGKDVAKAFQKKDTALLLQSFYSSAEVEEIFQIINRVNGGTGELDFSIDSIHKVFEIELCQLFNEALIAGDTAGIQWKKVKFVEIGLNYPAKLETRNSADLLLVLRYKKRFFMVTFGQCFQLDDGWKVGAQLRWQGEASLTEDESE